MTDRADDLVTRVTPTDQRVDRRRLRPAARPRSGHAAQARGRGPLPGERSRAEPRRVRRDPAARSRLTRRRLSPSYCWADRPRAGRWPGSRGRPLGALLWRHDRPHCRRSRASRDTPPRRTWSDPSRSRSRCLPCSGVVRSSSDSTLATIALGRQIGRMRFQAHRAGTRLPREMHIYALRRGAPLKRIVSVTAAPPPDTVPNGETVPPDRDDSLGEFSLPRRPRIRGGRLSGGVARCASQGALPPLTPSRTQVCPRGSRWRWFDAAVSP